jgi:DNA repair protein RadC
MFNTPLRYLFYYHVEVAGIVLVFKDRLTQSIKLGEGDIYHVSFNMNHIIQYTSVRGLKELWFIHNHPKIDCFHHIRPSKGDMCVAKELSSIAKTTKCKIRSFVVGRVQRKELIWEY